MSEKNTPVSKVTGTVSTDKMKGSNPMEKLSKVPAPKEVLQGTAMKALKVPGLRKILHTLAFARLVKVLRMIVGLIGFRALPVIALIIGGWLFRRFRRRG